MNLENTLRKYDYKFPAELIAKKPASPRDGARLLILGKNNQHDVFKNIGEYLPNRCVLVVNETKVLPARFEAIKESGGRVRILFLKEEKAGWVCLADRNLSLGANLKAGGIIFAVLSKKEGQYLLRPNKKIKPISFLNKNGQAPLPPYIKNTPLSKSSVRREYQTVFAKNNGSAAAPTASLHFTKKLISALKKEGVEFVKITLHVGLGTFASLNEVNFKKNKLHQEEYFISKGSAQKLNRAKKTGRKIVAVGTTSLRAIESALGEDGIVLAGRGFTDIFIKRAEEIKFIDGLITNFHVPKSSLLMLVCALGGLNVVKKAYLEAIKRKYRLFSFGDAMLILRG